VYTVVETDVFVAFAAQVWDDDERDGFVDWISKNPLAGDAIPATGGLRKVRWTRQGMGKRGGARVIYYNRLANGDIVLLMVYAKAKFDNIRPEVLRKIKEQYDG
jgi:hypothetical protein